MITKLLDRSASFYLETYDASCLNSTSYLNGIEAAVQDYVTAHRDLSVSDLDEYMKGSYDLDNSGQFLVTQDKKIELNISEDILKGGSQTTVDLGLTSQGEGWAKLTSNDGGLYQILLVEAYPPDVTSSVSISWIGDNVVQLILACSVAPDLLASHYRLPQ
jgi:hypothetical protein